MDDADLCYTPATELAGLISGKAVSPVELLDATLRRIERLEPDLNAFAYLAAEEARRAAQAAERAISAGATLGPLHGIPVTIKDHEPVAGMPLKYGTHLRKGDVAGHDGAVAKRLKAAGAVILGKTTTSEFGWSGISHSPLTGVTHNPWRRGLNAGASSAGAGAAAAAGFGPLHQGSDGAGSIRMPAHFCGVYGLKPTYGRVPQDVVAASDSTVHLGPITRTVADAALMLKVMAGPDSRDYTSCEAHPADYHQRLHEQSGRLRIAYSPDLGHARVDPEVARLVERAVMLFETELGHRVEAVTPGWGPKGPELARFFWPAHFQRHIDQLDRFADRMDQGLVACMESGRGFTLARYQQMRLRKSAYCAEIGEFFDHHDFLLTPAVSVAAFPATRLQPDHWPDHAWDWMRWAEFSYPFNLSQNPAASIPCGFTEDGLPVGLQIVGRRFDDLGVLQLSAAFERAMPWAHLRPSL